MLAEVYIDGLCRPLGPTRVAAYGFVIRTPGAIVEGSGIAGVGSGVSSNLAEYSALIEALRKSLEMGINEVVVNSDSKLLVSQMRGLWKVRKGMYVGKHAEAAELSKKFRGIEFRWVPREENREADRLSGEAYRSYAGRVRRRP